MVTSCLIGVLLLSAAVWSYRELEAFVIPTKEWNITVAIDHSGHATAPALAPGGSVEFFAPGSGIHDTGPRAVTGVVHEIRQVPGDHNATIVVRDISAVQKAAVPERNQVAVIGSARALVTATQAVPYFDLLYLQAGVVGLILVAGAIFIYWIVGLRRNSVEFLIATDGEMKKVNWSTRREVLGSTWVVIGACFLIATFLFIVDIAFSSFFEFVGLLKRG